MEFFYFCTTCSNYRRDAPDGTPSLPEQNRWCVLHERKLPKEVGQEHLICCDFNPSDPRANEWGAVIAKFPKGELWTFLMYYPSRKFATIADLPKVDPVTGEVIAT